MLGDPTLRTYDPNSFAQQAVTFLCLDFNGVSTKHNELPAKSCPSGIRAQIVRIPDLRFSKPYSLTVSPSCKEFPKLLGWKGSQRSLMMIVMRLTGR